MNIKKHLIEFLGILSSSGWLLVVAIFFLARSDVARGQASGWKVGGKPVEELEHYFSAEPDEEGIGGDMTTTNTSIVVHMITGRTKPELIAIFVSRDKPQNPRNTEAKWMPFSKSVKVDLGEEDGARHVYVAARWKVADKGFEGHGWGMTVRRSKPVIVVTEPRQAIVSQPYIQLKGYSPKPLGSIQYDRFNQAGDKIDDNADGFVVDQYFDNKAFAFTTNYFQCYDIELSPGTNTIILRCTDHAGNATTTNLIFVFATAGDTTPPVFTSIRWPQPGMSIAGDSFSLRGNIDDYTAEFSGLNFSSGQTKHISGFAERNGTFWYENIPLSVGINELTLTATDAAGNHCSTNLLVYGVAGPLLTMDPIPKEEEGNLWQGKTTVRGRVVPANYDVSVNGVRAVVKSDGSWVAAKVPVLSPDGGGVATFDMIAVPVQGATNAIAKPMERMAAQAVLGSNAMTLNASSPACGLFQIHLTNAGGQPFILLTSTNLTEWNPILTNVTPTVMFDYTDTNVSASACRFFRVVPIP